MNKFLMKKNNIQKPQKGAGGQKEKHSCLIMIAEPNRKRKTSSSFFARVWQMKSQYTWNSKFLQWTVCLL